VIILKNTRNAKKSHLLHKHSVRAATILHCVSKKPSPTFLAIISGRNITEKVSNQKMLYFFPPHLINASALSCETENMENVSFHINVSRWFANRHTSHIGIITE